jgi:hypothetical protein
MNAQNDSHAVTGFSRVNLAPLGNVTICATSWIDGDGSFQKPEEEFAAP